MTDEMNMSDEDNEDVGTRVPVAVEPVIDWARAPLPIYANHLTLGADQGSHIFALVFCEVGPEQQIAFQAGRDMKVMATPVASIRLPVSTTFRVIQAMAGAWNLYAGEVGLATIKLEAVPPGKRDVAP